MLRTFTVVVTALAFASSVLALNFTVGSQTFTPSQFLSVPAGPYVDACTGQCAPAIATVSHCTDTGDACLCTQDVADQMTSCEQCMLNFLVKMNMKAPDVRVGTNAGLAAYTAACNASTGATLKAAMVIAPDWDGSDELILATGPKVVVVGVGAIIGASALLLMSNL